LPKYYHITTPDSWEEIQKNGLTCDNEGNIFLLNTMYPAVVDYVAYNQLFGGFVDFVLIEVDDKGIHKLLARDNVAEAPAYLGHQWILKQECISKRHLKFIDERTLTEKGVKISRDEIFNKLGWEVHPGDDEYVEHEKKINN